MNWVILKGEACPKAKQHIGEIKKKKKERELSLPYTYIFQSYVSVFAQESQDLKK